MDRPYINTTEINGFLKRIHLKKMMVSLRQEIYDLIQETSSSNSDDINDKILAICDNMREATNIGQTIYEMYDNLLKEKNELADKNQKYGIITVGALNELGKSQISQNNEEIFKEISNPIEDSKNELFNEEFKRSLSKCNEQILSKIDSFINETDIRLNKTEQEINSITEKTTNFTFSKPNQNYPYLKSLSEIFQCTLDEVPSHIDHIIKENDAKTQLFEFIKQKVDPSENDMSNVIDSVIKRSEFIKSFCERFGIATKSEEEIQSFVDSVNHIDRISTILKTNPQYIDQTLETLIGTVNSQREQIDSLQKEKEGISLHNQQNSIQSREFEYNRFDHLVNFKPNLIENSPQTSLFESKIESMNENISKMKFQYNEALKNFNSIQERQKSEIENLKSILSSKENEIQLKEARIQSLQNDLNQETAHQNGLTQALSSFFGGIVDEDGILSKVYELNNENIKLRLNQNQKTEFRSKSSFDSDPSKIKLEQQLFEVNERNQLLFNENLTLKTTNFQFQQKISELQNQISSNTENPIQNDNQKRIFELASEVKNCQFQIHDLESQMNNIKTQSEKLSQSINQFSITNRFSNQSIQTILDSLQFLFLQFSLNDFARADQLLSSLLTTLRSMNFSPNDRFSSLIKSQFETFNQRLNETIGQFDRLKEKVVDIIEDQKSELLDFMENDYSAPYAALQVSYRELKEKYDLLSSNLEQNRPQYIPTNPPGHIQSRFVSPVRNQNRNNALSPSARVIDQTIRNNVSHPWQMRE